MCIRRQMEFVKGLAIECPSINVQYSLFNLVLGYLEAASNEINMSVQLLGYTCNDINPEKTHPLVLRYKTTSTTNSVMKFI